jgi:hypothetical protein
VSIETQTEATNDLENKRIDVTPPVSGEEFLLDGIDIAPDGWMRPGADALVKAVVDWNKDLQHTSEARQIISQVLGEEKQSPVEAEVEQRLPDLIDHELTDKVREWLETSDDPIIVAARQKLGDITPQTERKFELAVLSIDSGLSTPSDNPKAIQEEWSASLSPGGVVLPPAFVRKPTKDRPALLVLDKGTATAILDPKDISHHGATKAVVHEYGHTQRDMSTTDGIGNSLEERMAIIAAGGQAAYPETMVHANILNALTDGKYSELFNDVLKGTASMNELYNLISETAGSQAALAMAVIPPGVDYYHLPDYAQAFVEQGETNAMAIYRNITASVDPQAIATGFTNTNNLTAKWIMNNAMTTGITLHPEVIQALIQKLESADSPEWYKERLLTPENSSGTA